MEEILRDEDEITSRTSLRWRDTDLWTHNYIDDGISGEKLHNERVIFHLSTKKCVRRIRSTRCEKHYTTVKKNAESIGMKINSSKTQLLCINVARDYDLQAYIRPSRREEIQASGKIKILGFVFGPRPTTAYNTAHICRKFYSKLWTLRHLKRAKMDAKTLVRIYESYLRPTIEYCSNVYGPMPSVSEVRKIEKLQTHALRIIYGHNVSTDKMLNDSGLQMLEKRREQALSKFANKTLKDNKYFREKWFKERKSSGFNLRHGEKYEVKLCATERFKNSPLNSMRRLLNNEHKQKLNTK